MTESVIIQPAISRPQEFHVGRLTKELNMTGLFLLIAGVSDFGLYFVVAPAVASTITATAVAERSSRCPHSEFTATTSRVLPPS